MADSPSQREQLVSGLLMADDIHVLLTASIADAFERLRTLEGSCEFAREMREITDEALNDFLSRLHMKRLLRAEGITLIETARVFDGYALVDIAYLCCGSTVTIMDITLWDGETPPDTPSRQRSPGHAGFADRAIVRCGTQIDITDFTRHGSHAVHVWVATGTLGFCTMVELISSHTPSREAEPVCKPVYGACAVQRVSSRGHATAAEMQGFAPLYQHPAARACDVTRTTGHARHLDDRVLDCICMTQIDQGFEMAVLAQHAASPGMNGSGRGDVLQHTNSVSGRWCHDRSGIHSGTDFTTLSLL